MRLEGGCYCGKIRYITEGDPITRGQCHCRECQYIAGGGPNYFIAMPLAGFRYTQGAPKSFQRSDLEHPVIREFCADCGTHLITRPVGLPAVIVKVGTLNNPALFGKSEVALYAIDRQPFHVIPEGVTVYERLPPR